MFLDVKIKNVIYLHFSEFIMTEMQAQECHPEPTVKMSLYKGWAYRKPVLHYDLHRRILPIIFIEIKQTN